MPCRDYYADEHEQTVSKSSYDALKKRNDVLARVACTFANALEAELGVEITRLDVTKIMKGNLTQEAIDWLVQHKKDDARAEAERRKTRKRYKTALATYDDAMIVYNNMSEAQRKLLGVQKPKKPKKPE